MTKHNWDLKQIYKTESLWKEDLEKIKALVSELKEMKDSFIKDSKSLFKALEINEQIGIKLTSLFVYAKMQFDVDLKNQEAKKSYELVDALSHDIMNQLSFFEPELSKIDRDQFESFKKETQALSKYNFMFEKLFIKKPHILTSEMEEMLAQLNSLSSFYEKAYDDLTISDVEYPSITHPETDEKIAANNTNYYLALINPNREFRKDYFLNLLGTYRDFSNTLTSIYFGNVKSNVIEAKKRNYQSPRQMSLADNYVSEDIYDNLVNTVRENTKPLIDYIDYRRETLKYKDVHFYDLFLPLVPDFDKKYTYEEAKEIVLKALSVLGDEYVSILREAFENRWIDVYPGENKMTGAYAIDVYSAHPFSLLNFNGTLNDIFTIAHELGHVMHSYYSSKNQDYVNSNYSIFCAEVASTVNEQLLFHYLLENSTSKEEKAYLLNNHLDGIRSTFYRQTLFADFENITHNMVVEDKPLIPEDLANIYEGLYKDYYGDKFVIDEELKYEWARIPHFYSAFYVYQYATGISAAIAIADKILKDDDYSISNYFNFLKSGDSDYPTELLKLAGIDMTSPKPVLDTIDNFKRTFEELKNL